MEYNLRLNITDENNDFVQDLIVKLVMLEALDQKSARDLIINAKELKGIHYKII